MSFPRSDELANESIINRAKERDVNYKTAAKNIAGLGISIAGAGLSSKIAPFLSDLIPLDLAMKGINKVSPKLGDFLKKGINEGLDLKGGIDFIKQSFSKEQEKKAPDKRSIIEQYSPELFQFIKDQIGQGRSPLEAGALAKVKGFDSFIKKMEKDHKSPWSSILEATFGTGQTVQPQNTQQVPTGRTAEQAMYGSKNNQQPQNTQQAQPQQGQASQAILDALQKAAESRKRRAK